MNYSHSIFRMMRARKAGRASRAASWFLAALMLLTGGAAWAEGSVTMYSSNNPYVAGADTRVWLEYYSTGAFFGTPLQNSFEVYAKAGEYITMGSSANGLGGARIVVTRPNGTTATCGTTGARIATRAAELAGPARPPTFTVAGSQYQPCFVQIGASANNVPGIYRIQFTSPNPANRQVQNPPNTPWNAIWDSTAPYAAFATSNNVGEIIAWDISVWNSSGTQIPGRVWYKYMPLNAGDVGNAYAYVRSFVLTKDGYIFRQEQRLDPISYMFFANNRGIIYNPDGNKSSFKSINLLQSGTDQGNLALDTGYSMQSPSAPDTAQDITYKQFFNVPANDLPASAPSWNGSDDWLLRPAPSLPPTLENLTFTGADGTPDQAAGINGGGGTFTFTNPTSDQMIARIKIPLSKDGSSNTDRIIFVDAPPGQGSVVWDGLDGSGNPVIVTGSKTYTVQGDLAGGVVHFPYLDVERGNGIAVFRVNGPSDAAWPNDMLYWDHRYLAGPNQINPLINLNGLRSGTSPAMAYRGAEYWGNNKALDQWTYLPNGQPFSKNLTILSADIRIVKTSDFTPVGKGGAVAYTLTIDNLDAANFARAIRVQDILDPAITNATWTCEITKPGTFNPADPEPGPSQCATATGNAPPVLNSNGTGNIDQRIDLRAGGRAVFHLRGTVSATAPNNLANTATASRGADLNDPNTANNTSTVTVQTVPAQPVSGNVYEDLQSNGVRDPGENWNTGAPVWVTLVRNDGVVIESKQVPVGAGGYNFAGVPSGSYRLILTDANGSVQPVAPPGFSFTMPSDGVRTINVAGAPVTDQNFGLHRATGISGRVFEDNGAGGGVAANGIVDGTEVGLSGVTVQAKSGATVLATTTTAVDGTYKFDIPAVAGPIDIVVVTPAGYVAISENVGNTGAANPSVTDASITFTPTSGTSYSGINFGNLRQPSFAPDQVRTTTPGSTIFLPHTFTAHTSGTVQFSVPPAGTIATPNIPGWSTQLFRDTNCNGVFDSGEPTITGALPVDAGANSQICILLRVTAPSGVPVNSQLQVEIDALMAYDNTPMTTTLKVTDKITISDATTLILIKEVNVAKALPGDTLTYTLRYKNPAAEPVSKLEIIDATPPYTIYVGSSAMCAMPLPASITSCMVAQQPADGAVGTVKWTLGGSLSPGAEGLVQYKVKIEH